jgi:hypothetical protein
VCRSRIAAAMSPAARPVDRAVTAVAVVTVTCCSSSGLIRPSVAGGVVGGVRPVGEVAGGDGDLRSANSRWSLAPTNGVIARGQVGRLTALE